MREQNLLKYRALILGRFRGCLADDRAGGGVIMRGEAPPLSPICLSIYDEGGSACRRGWEEGLIMRQQQTATDKKRSTGKAVDQSYPVFHFLGTDKLTTPLLIRREEQGHDLETSSDYIKRS